jgi:membrane-associated phospholipid phosphatase
MGSHGTSDGTPPRARRLLRSLVYSLTVAVVFFGVGFLVRSRWGPLQHLDDAIIEAATSFTRPREGLRSFLLGWQWVTQPIRIYIVGTLLCLWVWLAKGLRTRAWWAFGTMMVAWLIGLLAKEVFRRARPVVEDPVSVAPGYSFPSGHALNSAAWATIVVLLLWPLLVSRAAKVAAVVLAVLLVVVTALDRVFLGVHYPSDVTVGVLTGVGLALASYAGYVGWNPPDPTEADDPDVGSVEGADLAPSPHGATAGGRDLRHRPTTHP